MSTNPTGRQAPRPYSQLSEAEKWEWHADVYAFRHVFLGKPKNEPTPCDENGVWYVESFVNQAIQNLLERRAAMARAKVKRADDHPDVQRNRERVRLAEEWRKSPEAQLDPAIARTGPSKAWGFKSPAQALGVTAREWTAEEMSEARRQIPGMTDNA